MQSISRENEKISVLGQEIASTAATQKELLEASQQITNALGINYNIIDKNEGDLLVNMKERMGLSEDLRQNLFENSKLSNQSFEDYFDTLLGVNVVNKANNKFWT